MKAIALIFIVSIVSFFLTREGVFPAYLISIPLTIYLAQKLYCNLNEVAEKHNKSKDNIFEIEVSFFTLIIIGILILVQTYLPQTFSFETLRITDNNLPVGLNVALGVLTYVSFIALSLVVDCKNNKLNLQETNGSFLFVTTQILAIQPMILLMFSCLSGGLLLIVISLLF